MNQEITDFIEALKEPWQGELAASLRGVVHQAVPDVQERMQYKKPHFLKNGKYAAVISTSKDAVSFTIFHAAGLELPEGMFDGPEERKTLKLRKGDTMDAGQLGTWLSQASSAL
ncbi:DUF1801 domain-containing protein [Paenibacillus nasutitermitis]|uniref:YdhG-like domain-containing protein n=1 Tax=Paenibacillus nasutitermitis TaxID=1652958 RepID=A0A916ZHE2_9BACL|nr:DUF1801 domain-containing protein [Paenibacillus nasutitermitis]GGD97141.1 hypothetical protein GCM10010911_64840 [Paenibacillus nasutitermitis]